MFSLQSPVIYMTAALVITLAAVLAGYVYTQKQQKTTQTGTGKAPLADAPAGASKTKHQTRKEPHCVKESHESKENVDLSMAAGPWPIDENDGKYPSAVFIIIMVYSMYPVGGRPTDYIIIHVNPFGCPPSGKIHKIRKKSVGSTNHNKMSLILTLY